MLPGLFLLVYVFGSVLFLRVLFGFNLLNPLPNNGLGHLDMYRNFIKVFTIPNLSGWKNGPISFFPQ